VNEKPNEHSNDPLTIAVEEQVEFTCISDGIESNPEASLFSFFMGGEHRNTLHSRTWDPVFRFVNDTGTYTCTANNSLGESEISNSKEVIVQGKLELKSPSEYRT